MSRGGGKRLSGPSSACSQRHVKSRRIAMKTFFKLLVLLGVVAYLFYVFADISGKRDSTRCKEVNVIIVDSSYAGFINADEVVRILKKEKRSLIHI